MHIFMHYLNSYMFIPGEIFVLSAMNWNPLRTLKKCARKFHGVSTVRIKRGKCFTM